MLRFNYPNRTLSIIIVVLFTLVLTPAFAQFEKLRDFGSAVQGLYPYASPISDGTFLYGTTTAGGANDRGTIYKVKPDGTGFTVLHDFDLTIASASFGSLYYDGTALFGMTINGGTFDQGTIYKINTDGTGFTILFNFEYAVTGGLPQGSLISDGNVLYGMTSQGGTKFYGTVFKINKDGTGHTKLVEFDNTNGFSPTGTLAYDGTYLYGMTNQGGSPGLGTAFKVQTDGSNFTPLIIFNGSGLGSNPLGSFFFDGTYLWGTTQHGGSSGGGTLFRILPDGNGYALLVNFNNTIGTFPKGSLVSDGTFLYGTTSTGGPGGSGTAFKINLNGTGFTTIADLTGYTAGPYAEGTFLLMGSTLYTAKSSGGLSNYGGILKVNTDGSNLAQVYSLERAGNEPTGAMVSDGTFLYGFTTIGGLSNAGTIYKIKTDGTGFQRLFDFDGASTGGRPVGSPYWNGGFLYGTTSQGGANDMGTAYKIKTDGTGFVKLLDFNGAVNGSSASGGFVSDGTFLYGMTPNGGSNGYGTIFKMHFDGTNYTKLLDFDYNGGANPNGELLLDGGFLYGLTHGGGINGFGVAFKIKPDGTGLQTLIDFTYDNGSNPNGGLTSDATFLYGVTSIGGSHNKGNIFKVKKDGTGFQTLRDLIEYDDGSFPSGSLISDGTYLYGLTSSGGVAGRGTIFKIKPDGTFGKMVDFNDGAQANGTLYSDGSFLYGTTSQGGHYDEGTFFKRSIASAAVVTNLIPSTGAVGTYVKINGNDFDPVAAGNTVKFNGVLAKVVSATDKVIVAVVPDGATTGLVSVTAGTTGTSIDNFIVSAESGMFDGKVETCDVLFTGNVDNDDLLTQTFIPGVAGARIRVTFTSMHIGDKLHVYDGPDALSPFITTLSNSDNAGDFTSTSPGGELTFVYDWQDSGSDWEAQVSCVTTGAPIMIDKQPADVEVCSGTVATISTQASGPANIKYQWQFSDDGSVWSDISNGGGYNNVATATLGINTTSGFGVGFYRCRVNGDATLEVKTNEAELVANPLPASPTGSNSVPVCGPAAIDLSVTGGTDGAYRWYTAAAGGTAMSGQVNSAFTTPLVSSSTTYYVSITDGTCESTRTPIVASIKPCTPPVITTTELSSSIAGSVTINLATLIADSENDLDLSTLKIVEQPQSGALATLTGTMLTINYAGSSFSGTDVLGIEVCDLTGLCSTQHFNIDVVGDLVIFNAVSPNGDGKNEFLLLQYIDLIPAKKNNVVKIFNRWGDEVFSVANYNNNDKVFNGINKNGNKLPSGTYFYKISFSSGDGDMTGYLELKY